MRWRDDFWLGRSKKSFQAFEMVSAFLPIAAYRAGDGLDIRRPTKADIIAHQSVAWTQGKEIVDPNCRVGAPAAMDQIQYALWCVTEKMMNDKFDFRVAISK